MVVLNEYILEARWYHTAAEARVIYVHIAGVRSRASNLRIHPRKRAYIKQQGIRPETKIGKKRCHKATKTSCGAMRSRRSNILWLGVDSSFLQCFLVLIIPIHSLYIGWVATGDAIAWYILEFVNFVK
jgi:hypothetical protein